jgi:hypothetical protein
MRPLLVLFALLSTVAMAGVTTEVLVLTTATALPQVSLYRRGMLIENRGPNAIWCAFSAAAAVVNKSHRVGPASEQPGNRFPFNSTDKIWCVAESANQVTGAATVVSEVE